MIWFFAGRVVFAGMQIFYTQAVRRKPKGANAWHKTVICNFAKLCMTAKYQFTPRRFFARQRGVTVKNISMLPLQGEQDTC
jgi:hypothetical protein